MTGFEEVIETYGTLKEMYPNLTESQIIELTKLTIYNQISIDWLNTLGERS